MIEMESALEVLAEDPSGYHLKQLREELFDMRTTGKRVMDAGMTADEMSVAKRVFAAVECADEVAGRVHASLNG